MQQQVVQEKRKILSESHRHLLQHILAKGYEEVSVLRTKLSEYKIAYDDREKRIYNSLSRHKRFQVALEENSVEEYIETINTISLAKLDLFIQKLRFKGDGKEYYVLYSQSTKDDIAKMSSHLKDEEVQFFKRVLERIGDVVEDPNTEGVVGCSYVDCLNERGDKIGFDRGEVLLHYLINKGWLYRNDETRQMWYGVRSCMDLRGFLELES